MKATRKLNKPDPVTKLVLEEVIGLTTKNSNGLASNALSSKCAYLAGSVVVMYDMNLGTQSHLMVSNRMPKPLSCVALSRDGRFVAAGEAGNQSSVLVWDSFTLSVVSELKGHLHGVTCICFSPKGKHLVSVGGYMYVWNWRSGELITKLQATSCSTISSISFSSDGNFFVTSGKKHLKFWILGSSRKTQLYEGLRKSTSLAIHEKPVNLSIHKASSVTSISSVWCCNGYDNCKKAGDCFPIYTLTDSGILYLINSGMSVEKSVTLKVRKAFALSASAKLIACACNNGTVQLLNPISLEYVGSILYSKTKNLLEGSNLVSNTIVPEQPTEQLLALPDAIACQFSALEKIVVVYGDHSLYIYDIHDVNQVTKCYVLVSHSSCIWDIKNLCCENMHDPSLACTARGCLGGISFATCSTDGTIRIWDIALQSDFSNDAEDMKTELLSSSCLVTAGTFERDAVKADVTNGEFRSLAVSSDRNYLAAGDSKGNLHIYNLQTSDYTCFQGAHDGEILTLSFTLSTQDISKEIVKNNYFLASGGRDCMIHLYDVKRNFDLIDSIDDHSAAVTSIKISSNGCRILSCSADSFLVLRDVVIADDGYKILQQHRQKALQRGTVYDMAVDLTCETVVTVGQDKKIKTFDMAAQKLIKSHNHDKNFGEPIKVIMDPSCSYAVCSFSNKSICIYDLVTGKMAAKAAWHAEIVTGVIFLPDCKHIVSVDGTGCVFVWKLPASLSSRILERVMERNNPLSPRSSSQPPSLGCLSFCNEEFQHSKINPDGVWSMMNNSQHGDGMLYPETSHREASSFKFSVSRLPRWAQAKVTRSNGVCKNLNFTSSEVFSPLSTQVQIPSGNASPSPDTVVGGTYSNIPLHNHWHSVYTVCTEALSSPEMLDLCETKFAKIPLNIRQHRAVISEDQNSFGLSKNEKMDVAPDQNVSCNNKDVSWCSEEVSESKAEQLYLSESGSVSKTTTEGNLGSLPSEEDSDMFKQHFGSLSHTRKAESRKSLVRRFSARYTVQWDYPGDLKKLFSSPVGNTSVRKSSKDEGATHIISEDGSSQVKEIEEVRDSSGQDIKNSEPSAESTCELIKFPVKENSVDKESEQGETIPVCKDALGRLDVAAENAMRLFSELEKFHSEEVATEAGAQFLDEAAELLSLVVKKVNAVDRLVQCRLKGKCGSTLSVPETDQFDRFAEGKSDRIVEIPKDDVYTF
ncbi:mitogen-activated protein kinase-binding protein 1 isoform X1 [Vigna unguiculata]|uniref:mitogen-activated protein kinase-binding protein 1 isoform X1 n=1 Tax=Vigna unguiculata TaxID=3917 RepID=UPI00101701D4|nr:mitogen-activated protein kinase-binding protein 1 isoform X1 [Vigna unguiculata]